MKRVAFLHDHIFFVDQAGAVFSPGRLPYAAFERYLEWFDEVIVIGRFSPIAVRTPDLVTSSGPGVTFALEHGYKRPSSLFWRSAAIARYVDSVVSRVSAVIARLPSELGLIGAAAAKRQAKPLAVEVVAHAGQAYRSHGSIFGGIYGRLVDFRTARAIAQAEFALYVTDRFLQSLYPCTGQSGCASNVELPPRNPAWLHGRAERLAGSKAPFRLGYIGSLQNRRKGLDLALEAVALLVGKGHQVNLSIVGDGSDVFWREVACKLGIESHVEFQNPLPGSLAVQQWLREIDCLLHPSRAEGLPRVVIEAMWVACPLVASNAGGTSELIDEGVLFEIDDLGAMVEVIETLLSTPALAHDIVKRHWDSSERFSKEYVRESRRMFWKQFAASVGQ